MEENKQTTVNEQPTTTEAAESKTYSQEEVEKLIQSEADRRVNQALTKKEREMSKKLSEAEKLAKMSEEDKFRYQLEQKEAELAAKEREFVIRDNKIAAMKVLSDKQIAADLVDFVVHEDADVMKQNIDRIDRFIKQSVAEQVKTRLASPTPKAGLASTSEITPESFKKMNYSQRMELYKNNKELYDKLTGN